MLKSKIYPSKGQDFQHNANLHWIVNGKIKETIISNQPYKVCNACKRDLKNDPAYRGGKLTITSVQAKEQTK